MGRFIIESPSDVGRNENKQGRERRRFSVDFESRASKGDCVEMMSRLRSDNESVSIDLWNRCEDYCDVHLLIKVIAIVDNELSDSLTLSAVIDSIIFPSMHIEFPD